MKVIMAALTLLLTFALSHPAQARHHHYKHRIAMHASYTHAAQSSQRGQGCVSDNSGHTVCGGSANQTLAYGNAEYPVDKSRRSKRHIAAPTMDANGNYDERVVGHPSGCPRIAFCGCGASVKIFGRPVRSLYLASNWFRFPRTAPAPGMVAVRNHHVFVIEQVYGDGTVMAYDANSGGHATRVHRVSLQGYSVRNPHGA